MKTKRKKKERKKKESLGARQMADIGFFKNIYYMADNEKCIICSYSENTLDKFKR